MIQELNDSPKGATVTVGQRTYRKTWSGAWECNGLFLSADQLSRVARSL